MQSLGAEIVNLEDLARRRAELGRLVVTSGGYDPIHPGHISCILDSRKYGSTLAVVVNGDAFLRAKKGQSFQNLETRCQIVSAIRGVDFVVPFEIENDATVCRALEMLRPAVFTKGGDRRDAASIPEWEICRRLNIEVALGVGMGKHWSSSEFLAEWEKFTNGKHNAGLKS